MANKPKISNIIVYQASNGAIELKGDLNKETLWANRKQMANIFEVNPQAISKHIHNIYKEGELLRKGTSSTLELVQDESGRMVKRMIDYYNLDVLIAVGYRINSIIGTKFRKRATKMLKQHITKGYTINQTLLQKNYTLFQQAISDIQELSQCRLSVDDVLELIKVFGQTRFSLDAFDKEHLQTTQQTQKTIHIEAKKLYRDIAKLKKNLISKGEATDFFAQEKKAGSLEGIVGNVFQNVFGQDVYPSIESKASHLLYFIIKNHPFTDGNKRSGAFAFVWFLQKAQYSFRDKITPQALTAVTLLIAISNPKDKQKMIDLVILLLSGK